MQAEWLTTVCEIALSKPYVETVCIQALVDRPDDIIADGGVLRENLTAKPALARLIELRKRLLAAPDK